LAKSALSLGDWGLSLIPLTLRLGSFSADREIASFTPRGHLLRVASELEILPHPSEGGTYTCDELMDGSFVSDGELYRSIIAEARARLQAMLQDGRDAARGNPLIPLLETLCQLKDFDAWTSLLISRAPLIIGTATGLAKRVGEFPGQNSNVSLEGTVRGWSGSPGRRTLIIEEASRLPEFDLAALLLLRPERLILLGDVLQLPPLIRNSCLAHVAQAGASAFHRLLHPGSGIATVVLQEQGRAHPQIADVYRAAYASHLPESFRLVGGLRDLPRKGDNDFFMQHIERALGGRVVCIRPSEASLRGGVCSKLLSRILLLSSEENAPAVPSQGGFRFQGLSGLVEEITGYSNAPTGAPTNAATQSTEVNPLEASVALALGAALKARFQSGPGGTGERLSITFLSLYRKQAEYIASHPLFQLLSGSNRSTDASADGLKSRSEAVLTAIYPEVTVTSATTDEFQGLEADIIILSLVKEFGTTYGNDFRRSLVALSRAREFLIVVGNVEGYDGELWTALLTNSTNHHD